MKIFFRLHTIIPKRDTSSKTPPPIQIATELYERTIKSIIAELNTEYQKYWRKEKGVCKNISTPIFLRHLKSCGIYEKFITSTERAIALLVKEKYKFGQDHTSAYAHDVKKTPNSTAFLKFIFYDLVDIRVDSIC